MNDAEEEQELRKRIVLMKYLHTFAHKYYHAVFVVLSVIVILVGTVTSSFMFYGFSQAQQPEPVDVVMAVLDLLGACMSAICLFLKPGVTAQKHLHVGKDCQKLLLQIHTQDLSLTHRKLSELVEENLEPPSFAIRQFRKLCDRRKLDSNDFLYADLDLP